MIVVAVTMAVAPSAWGHARRSSVTAGPAAAHAPNTAKAWGANYQGQLGIGTTEGPEKCKFLREETACSANPLAVNGLGGVSTMAGGGFDQSSLALLDGGTVMAWGGTPISAPRNLPAAKQGLSGVAAIAAGDSHSLALRSNGTVRAWGTNEDGQLGDGTTTESEVPVAVCAVGVKSPCTEDSKQLKDVIAVAAGNGLSLALLSNHAVVAWGGNELGQLGSGSTKESNVPVPVCAMGAASPCTEESKQLKGVMAIAAGESASFALLSTGKLMAWGSNRVGELGDGASTGPENCGGTGPGQEKPCSETAREVSGLTGVAAISTSGRSEHILALVSDGSVKAWGRNNDGQLGDGTSAGPDTCGAFGSCSRTPVTVCSGTHPGPCPTDPLRGATAIAAGRIHSVALLSNGMVKTWGDNKKGQLGAGTLEGPERCGAFAEPCSTTPVAVGELVDTKGIAAGDEFSFAFGPPPTVTTVKLPGKRGRRAVAHGPPGTTVTITGLDFAGVSAVKFGSVGAASFTVNSPTSITAVSPPHRRGEVYVTVTTIWGTSATSEADIFRYRRR